MIRSSSLFPRTLREAPREAEARSHELLLRAGCIRREAPGVYTWLPLGLRLLRAVSDVVRSEMDHIGAQEVLLPALLPRSSFEPTGRWSEFGDGLFRLKDRTGAEYLLGPTHEEVFASLVGAECSSYRDLPLTLYQIQTKYRDELRSRGGLLRGREFVMKDSYSFDLDEDGLTASYAAHRRAYESILARLGIQYSIVAATAGAMGGSASEEFLAHSDAGEDTFLTCRAGHGANLEVHADRSGVELADLDVEALSCLVCGEPTSPRRGIEVGHIFQLGRKYTDALEVSVVGADGKPLTPLMGSYGIGVSRLVAVLAEQYADDAGLCWPSVVAPIQVHLVALGRSGQLEAAESLGRDLEARGWRVALDDRGAGMGVMMKDAELLGAPCIVVVGRGLAAGTVELLERATGERRDVSLTELAGVLEATR